MTKKASIKVEGKKYVGIVVEVEGENIPFTSIKDSTSILGYKHPQYTRRLLLEGKFDGETTSLPFSPIKEKEGKFSKWFIPVAALYSYLNSRVERDNRRRFIIRFPMADLEKIEKALKASKVEYTLELAYKKGQGNGKAHSKATPEKEEVLEEFTFNPS